MNKAFTIIELLFVIVIISILVMISYPRLTGITNKAYDTNIQSSAGTFRNLMNMFYQDNNKYPSDTYDFIEIKDNILSEYGQLGDIKEVLDSHSYTVNNESDPKFYKLQLISSKSDKTYIITPDNVKTTE